MNYLWLWVNVNLFCLGGCCNGWSCQVLNQSHRNGKVVRVTVLVFTGDVEACLQRLQWISGLSPWRPFRFSGIGVVKIMGCTAKWIIVDGSSIGRLHISSRALYMKCNEWIHKARNCIKIFGGFYPKKIVSVHSQCHQNTVQHNRILDAVM